MCDQRQSVGTIGIFMQAVAMRLIVITGKVTILAWQLNR
jgi:hypothetical protein